jgi:hypothetical protein
LKNDSEIKIEEIQGDNKANSDDNNLFINLIDGIIFQKWYVKITLIINAEFQITTVALIDSGTDMNCIQERIIPTKYYEKTTKKLHQASRARLNIDHKISNAHVCNNEICFKTTFILVKNITSKIILRTPFLALFDLFIKTEEGISTEIIRKKILFKFILSPITRDMNMLKNIFIFQEINIISRQIKDRENVPSLEKKKKIKK